MGNVSNLNVNLAAKLIAEAEVKDKILNFTKALEELPKDLNLSFALLINGKETEGEPLKINLEDILVEQVKDHFSKKETTVNNIHVNVESSKVGNGRDMIDNIRKQLKQLQ